MISANQVFAGTVLNLVQKGIPAVIAMQYNILDDTAKLFADEFYSILARSYPVDEAIQKTRNAISQEVGLDKPDFATPTLYMRAKDGIILDIKKNQNQLTSRTEGQKKILLPDPFDEETFNREIHFTGRDDEKKKLKEWLINQHNNQKIVIISGTSGVGKSTLACEFALQNQKDFPGGIYGIRVNEERFANSEDFLAKIAKEFLTELGIKPDDNTNSRNIIKEMKRRFADTEALLIFDNVETYAISKLFPSGKSSIIVTTTNKNLYEQLPECEPLEVLLPNEVDSEDLREILIDDSLKLLKKLVKEDTSNEITKNESTAKEILNLIGYLPLVVKVISRMLLNRRKIVSLEELLNDLTNVNRLQYLKPNHKSENNKKGLDVRYSFALILKDMIPEVQKFFACLGACANSHFSLDLISKTAGFSEDEGFARKYLYELEDNYFVKQYCVNERENYFIPTHNLIHDFAKFLLEEKEINYLDISIPESLCEDARQNHANYFVNLIKDNQSSNKVSKKDFFEKLNQDFDNFYLAIEYLAKSHDSNLDIILDKDVVEFFTQYRYGNQYIQLCNSCIDGAKYLNNEYAHYIYIHLKFSKNKFLQGKNNLKDAKKLLETLEVEIFDYNRNPPILIAYNRAVLEKCKGGLFGKNKEFDQAEKAYQESIRIIEEEIEKIENYLDIFDKLSDTTPKYFKALTYRSRGLNQQRKGEKYLRDNEPPEAIKYFEQAANYFEKALEILNGESIDDKFKKSLTLGNLGEVLLKKAEIEKQNGRNEEYVESLGKAIKNLEHTLKISEQEGLLSSQITICINLGKTYLVLGDLNNAQKYLIKSIENNKLLNKNGIFTKLIIPVKKLIKEYAKEKRSFEDIESLLNELPDDDINLVRFLNELADIYTNQELYDTAVQLVVKTIMIDHSKKNIKSLVMDYIKLLDLFDKRGTLKNNFGIDIFELVKLNEELGEHQRKTVTLTRIAKLLGKDAKYEKAIKCLEESIEICIEYQYEKQLELVLKDFIEIVNAQEKERNKEIDMTIELLEKYYGLAKRKKYERIQKPLVSYLLKLYRLRTILPRELVTKRNSLKKDYEKLNNLSSG